MIYHRFFRATKIRVPAAGDRRRIFRQAENQISPTAGRGINYSAANAADSHSSRRGGLLKPRSIFENYIAPATINPTRPASIRGFDLSRGNCKRNGGKFRNGRLALRSIRK